MVIFILGIGAPAADRLAFIAAPNDIALIQTLAQ
jgi:hypothetical protein